MPEEDDKGDDRPTQFEKLAERIVEKAETRIKAGRDDLEAYWQAVLESYLVAVRRADPGRLYLISAEPPEKESWDFFWEVSEKVDLPPDTIALMIPSEDRSERDIHAHRLIVSRYEDHTKILVAALPGLESSGIDVFDDGHHLVDYSYYTIKECLDELSDVIWTFFAPRKAWTKEQIIQYTENWFLKSECLELEALRFHTEYSYVHHPELIGLSPIKAILRLLASCIPKQYEDLNEMIEVFNQLNQDITPEEPLITRDGLMNDDLAQCQAFYGRITCEMDMALDMMEDIEGIVSPRGIEGYRDEFDEAAKGIYEKATDHPCPRSVDTGWDQDFEEDDLF